MKTQFKTLHTKTGGQITLDMIEGSVAFSVGAGYMYGVLDNTAETRRFFRTVSKQLDKAAKRKPKSKQQSKKIAYAGPIPNWTIKAKKKGIK